MPVLRISLRISGSALCLALAGLAHAADVGVVTHVKVLSDKVPDVSSIDAWKKGFITDGMSDQEKALTCWKTVWTFQHQDNPPAEYLQHDEIVYDAIKVFNVYGYAMCGNAAAHQVSLARNLGLEGRGWGINCHSVSEITWDGAWHMLDPSLINYFPKADGAIAGVVELTEAVQAWYKDHPEYWDGTTGNDAKLRELHKDGGWQGWRKGPELVARCPTITDRGWYAAKTHGWYSTMQEYDGVGGGTGNKQFLYEYGASEGYQVNIRLRPGERIVRNWSNKGLHINQPGGGPGCLTGKIGEGSLAYSAANGDLANGRVGNGTHAWTVPLADRRLAAAAWSLDNVAAGDAKKPALRAKDAGKDAVVVLRMPSSYVYLSGTATAQAVVDAGGAIAIQFSDNNGLDWKDVATIEKSGEQAIDLAPFCFRRYDYLLKLTLRGAGTGLDALTLTHDIQHSQRPLPALAQGENTLSFSAGTEDTVTVEATSNGGAQGKQVTVADTHPTYVNMDASLKLSSGEGSVTIPVTTPADMVRLRFGGFYRNWSDRDAWEYSVSFDDGKTFRSICQAPKQMAGCTKYVTVSDIPKGTRKALVRYTGRAAAATMLWSYRIDADYVAPGAGFTPVKVTYAWSEGGAEKSDVHVAKRAEDAWTITCADKPTMTSITLELAE
ncbi:MAG TPA: hypothetical protein VEL07_15960 [Planctomycetota bacterium]|nr:hypothetical protein [Planctomycetota bacterium]